MKTSEYVSRDMLEESHLKSFSPFRSIQMILGSCRVHAKYRFVTSPTKGQMIYTVIYLLIILSLYISVVINNLSRFYPHPTPYYLIVCAICLHYGTFACNIIHVRFMNNDVNVQFYIRMQEIDRKLKIDQHKIIYHLLFRTNLITVVVLLIVLLFLFIIAEIRNVKLLANFLGPLFAELTSTLEWLHCANLLIYFYLRLRYINAIMTNYLEGTADIDFEKVKKQKIPTMKLLRYLVSDTHDFQYSEIDVYLKNIFEELVRFQCLYRFQVFLFCFKFVTITIMMFEFGLLGLQYNILQGFEFILLPTVTAIDLIIIIVICIRCEAFFKEVGNTKYLCIKVLSRIYSGPLRKKAIRMLKMIKEKPPQFSVYDMWHMEASTMISMVNLVTTLMVTLLQFALL